MAKLFSCSIGVGPKSEQHQSNTVDATNITNVQLSGKDGDVTISPSSGPTGSVDFTKRTPKIGIANGDCHGNYGSDGTTLVVNISKDSMANCEMDAHIFVPAATGLKVNLKDGNLVIRDMQGSVTASTSDGNVDINLVQPSAGPAAANANVNTSDGNIKLVVGFAPVSGQVTAATKDGNIKLGLANGTVFTLSEEHKDGNFHDDFTPAASAPFAVSLKSNDGNLKIEQN